MQCGKWVYLMQCYLKRYQLVFACSQSRSANAPPTHTLLASAVVLRQCSLCVLLDNKVYLLFELLN